MTTKQPKPSAERAITNWDEELAKLAATATETEASTATGSFFSIRAGTLSWNDQPLANNQVAAVILDGVLENVFYESDYDSDNPQPPTCFAFGRDEATLAPHADVVAAGQAVSERCHDCPNNAWNSGPKGRGKACRNVRRLALLPAGTFAKDGSFTPLDAAALSTAAIGFLKIPVTSVKGYASYVKQVAASLKRPPLGMFTRISVVPDPKTQLRVCFEALDTVPNALMSTLMKRREEAAATIEQPYSLEAPEPRESAKPVRRGASAKAPSRRRY